MQTTENARHNRLARPGFLISAVVVAVIAALGIYLGVTAVPAHSDPANRTPAQKATPAQPGSLRPSATSASVCGLTDAAQNSRIELRSTTWRYSNATAFPTSPAYGPGRLSDVGYRYCFQHSASGALFCAANALAFDNSSKTEAQVWSDYMMADGRYRRARLKEAYVPNDPSVRLEIIGYRLMSYTAQEAWVDIAVRTYSPEGTSLMSVASDLVWQHGDWRFSTSELESSNVVRIDDLTGYTSWSAA